MKKLKFTFLLFYLFTFLPLASLAQSETERYRAIYDHAEQDYSIGRLEEAQQSLKDNLSNFPLSLRMSAYRMLSLCYLGLDQDDAAEDYVRLLLDENPYYSTTASDPQRFIDMVENIKAGRTATITTASSQSEQLSEVPVPTTLITQEMIQDCGARNLQEVLATYVPGMNIVDCNDDINIAMRGIYSTGQEKILIMLNGHRLNSYCTNIAAPDFSISLEKVKQIEVLRGPASSLYGGVSLTAVVNVITKQGADVDGLEAKAGIGNYEQLKGGLLFGKRYFDLDLLIWGSFYKAKGESVYISREETGMQMTDGDVIIGGIGPKPNYDFGLQMKYRNLQFLYNATRSQIVSPFTMSYTFSPYTLDKYRTLNGLAPSYAT
ncbi:MAG: TonB-dependent receptor plug domain-containing protein, partial [Prevotella sp.]